MNKIIASIFATVIFVLACQNINAQNVKSPIVPASQLSNDGSINQFRNIVYNSIYTPEFWSKSFIPSFAVLKIDINASGHVTDIQFSDSADTLFVRQFEKRKSKLADEKALLERFAKTNSYKDISIIIPVNYEPNYGNKRSFYYDQMESLMLFNKKQFTGKAIILATMNIAILTKGNM